MGHMNKELFAIIAVFLSYIGLLKAMIYNEEHNRR